MEETATTVATEVTKGILDMLPADSAPYVLMVIIISAIFVFSIFVVYKALTKGNEKTIEEVRKSYDNIMKSQQETIHDLTKIINKEGEQ